MLPETDVIQKRDPALICEDTFNEGPNGWTQLMEGVHGVGPVVLDSEITYDGSRYSMLMMTGEQSYHTAKPWGNAALIKRMSRGPVMGKVYAEWWFAYGARRATTTSTYPRMIDFGIDQCDPDGNRRFFKLRWRNYDEDTATVVSKMQIHDTSAGSFSDVPGGDAGVELGINENKRNLYHVELVVDLDAGVYDGARVNGKGWGSLASTPDTTLRAYGPPPTVFTPFASGLNGCFEMANRLETDLSQCWANLAYFRAVNV